MGYQADLATTDLDALTEIPTRLLARVYNALHDLKDGELHEAILNLIWHRHAAIGGDWPRREDEIGDPNAEYQFAHVERAKHWLVGYCGDGPSPTGRDGIVKHDANHQVARKLHLEVDGRLFDGTECTCGRRRDRESRARLSMKWRQVTPDAHVWPWVTLDVPGAGRPIPHIQVCRFSRGAEDPDHAPNALGMQCLCGAYLGRHHPSGNVDRLLPAF